MTHLAPALWRAGDPAFPSSLANVPSPPKQLFSLGDRSTLDAPRVAIVGTRQPSHYGLRVTRQIATALAQNGVCVVSGMAAGIDACAHQATLDANGKTVAVLGAGIDKVYPSSHGKLYRSIAEKGMVLSEFAPGTEPFRGCFPRRNRVIAGLSSLTIVVEAGFKSGALITANYAADMGRPVAAVPGPIDSAQSVGANQLLRDGAHVIASVDDALALVTLSSPMGNTDELVGDEAIVFPLLSMTPISVEAIVAHSQLSAARALVALSNLELRRLARVLPTGEFRRA